MNASHAAILSLPRTGRMLCPECSQDRRKTDPTLSVTVFPDRHVYDCHHCGFSGVLPHEGIPDYVQKWEREQIKKIIQFPARLSENDRIIRDWFKGRGISITDKSVLPQITTGVHFFRDVGKLPAIGFVYGPMEQPDAIKWRALDQKAFVQDGAAREFYGLERINEGNSKTIVIVEGEADVVALASIGIVALSVPNGAPMKISNGMVLPEDDKKYSFVWEAHEMLEAAEKVILAVDADAAGDALAEELARRIDRAKCWRTRYPKDTKDPTDVIRLYGAEVMKAAIDQSVALPLKGVYSAEEYSSLLLELYEHGTGKGETTGISKDVDDLFTIMPGEVSIVTGMPGSGKSEFIDQIIMNLAVNQRWKTAIASFENPVHMHIAKLTEKYLSKPFFDGVTPRMTHRELMDATAFIHDHFCFLENKDGSLSTIDNIIARFKQAVQRLGVRCAVIDPYNYIAPDSDESEHKQVSDMLTKVKAFASAYGIHVFFVAHPAKMYPREDGTYAVPKGMNISGSAAWFAKADIGMTVHRGAEGVEIHCWKVRFKWVGKVGMCLLDYHIPTGRYLAYTGKVGWRDNKPTRQQWTDFSKDLPF